ncbi:GntR family transcriptional regulator [Caulobacter sp. LARHSG274]
MPPKRDAFALALGALRRRLRQGEDAPGAALPIQLIAAELRLSTTPVREVLSRLAGEHLVDKRGPVYTRPHLAELYALRALLLETALTPDAGRRARRRIFPERPMLALGDELALSRTPADIVTTLFFELVLGAGDLILAQAYQAASERLAPYQPLEAQVFCDLDAEAWGLIAAFEAQDPRALLLGAKAYHRRRIAAAAAISSLALGEKYRTDMV